MSEKNSTAQILGRHIITDPKICHGKPTFRGTRVLVADALEQVPQGLAWETIIEEWNNSISKEAVELASQAFLNHTEEIALERRSDEFIIENQLPDCSYL